MGLNRKQRVTLIIIIIGTFVTVLNQTLVTPALPSIMDEMSIDASTGQWLTTGFTLVNAIMIPITAYLQDRFSTKGLFVFSTSVFALGTLCCAWGFDFNILLLGRLIQAAGAGILMPLSMTVLLVTFPIEKRGLRPGHRPNGRRYHRRSVRLAHNDLRRYGAHSPRRCFRCVPS